MERNTPIADMVAAFANRDFTRFHMPGHKGDPSFFGGELLKGDITELPGTDTLHDPRGVIGEAQDLHAKRVGAKSSFFVVNGASAGVAAMLLAGVEEGGRVLFARDVHISAVNAMVLHGIEPVFIPVGESIKGLPGCVTAGAVKRAITENPDAKAVFLTYPNYYGMCCDIKKIAQAVHAKNMLLLVDGAHAAHFCFSALLPVSPGEAGADIWVTSAHKTLPAMNQCAYLNVGENCPVPADKIKRTLNMLQTTSPSYPLLASMDYASYFMESQGKEEIYRVVSLAEKYMGLINEIQGLRAVGMEETGKAGIYDRDILKLVIDVSGRGLTGFEAKRHLMENGVYAETADGRYLLLLITVADTRRAFDELLAGLYALPQKKGAAQKGFSTFFTAAVQNKRSPKKAACGKIKGVAFMRSAGYISAVPAGVYPPGVPVIIPGQIITLKVISYIDTAIKEGYDVFGLHGQNIYVVDDK